MLLKPDGTRWRTGAEVKGKLPNGVSSQYSHATSERGVSSITNADAHISAASSRLNWGPRRFKWTRPFLRKTKYGFWACAITFQTQSASDCNVSIPNCLALNLGTGRNYLSLQFWICLQVDLSRLTESTDGAFLRVNADRTWPLTSI